MAVDGLLCLHEPFPQGMEKAGLLPLTEAPWPSLSREELLSQAEPYRRTERSPLSLQTYAIRFFVLLCGVPDDTIPDSALYLDGQWHAPS